MHAASLCRNEREAVIGLRSCTQVVVERTYMHGLCETSQAYNAPLHDNKTTCRVFSQHLNPKYSQHDHVLEYALCEEKPQMG